MDKAESFKPDLVLFNISNDNKDNCLNLAKEIYAKTKTCFLFVSDPEAACEIEKQDLDYNYYCLIEPFEKDELRDSINSVIDKNKPVSNNDSYDDKEEKRETDDFFSSAVSTQEAEPEIVQAAKTENKPQEMPGHVLKSVIEATHKYSTIDEILSDISGLLQNSLENVDFVSAYTTVNQKAELRCSAGLNDNAAAPRSLNYSNGLAWAAIIAEDIVYIKDINESKYVIEADKQPGFKCCISLPLKQNGLTIGSLNLFSVRDTDAFSDEDMDLLNTSCRQIELTFSYLSKNEELKESEDRFQSLFDKSPVGVLLLDSGYKVYQCNRRIAEILQTTFDKIVGLDIRELGNEKFTSSGRKMLKGSFCRCEFSLKIPGKRKATWLMASLSFGGLK
ncbi:MAG: GAF domain-containing protein [Candidatus Dadabacteria bacterium]|nr:GAF domain-containing protein [Candidatus Dadabacteria bacterium]NIS07263.1 GAF domain-containing protein [Candidatus Dadabacteria bacterium]NIV40970.1 GAF domain-containing protein [Candidatus Dadabacteria bacterium]NIY21201.1 GAF domain-containing protein [Candidatus Dadabacteria bacterium]